MIAMFALRVTANLKQGVAPAAARLERMFSLMPKLLDLQQRLAQLENLRASAARQRELARVSNSRMSDWNLSCVLVFHLFRRPRTPASPTPVGSTADKWASWPPPSDAELDGLLDVASDAETLPATSRSKLDATLAMHS